VLIDELDGRNEPWLGGDRVKLLDGSHWPGTEPRIKPLRFTRAGALPGHSLVVLDPERMLVVDVVLGEDGHAQERSMTEAILEMVRPGDPWIKDRNFGTTAFLFGIAQRGGAFVTRQQGSTLSGETVAAGLQGAVRDRRGLRADRPAEQRRRRDPVRAADHRGVGSADPRRRSHDSHPDPLAGGDG
jgi:hypothetical protein